MSLLKRNSGDEDKKVDLTGANGQILKMVKKRTRKQERKRKGGIIKVLKKKARKALITKRVENKKLE